MSISLYFCLIESLGLLAPERKRFLWNSQELNKFGRKTNDSHWRSEVYPLPYNLLISGGRLLISTVFTDDAHIRQVETSSLLKFE